MPRLNGGLKSLYAPPVTGGQVQGGASLEGGQLFAGRSYLEMPQAQSITNWLTASWLLGAVVIANLVIAALALPATRSGDTGLNGLAIFAVISAAIVVGQFFLARVAFAFGDQDLDWIMSGYTWYAIFFGLVVAYFVTTLISMIKALQSATATNTQTNQDIVLFAFAAALLAVTILTPVIAMYVM